MKWIISFLFGAVLFCYASDVGFSENRTTEAYNYGLEAHRRGDYLTAFRAWRPLAERGHAVSQYNLGRMYAEGIGVPEDNAEAVYWLRKAAEQGYADAQEIVKYIGESCSKYWENCNDYWENCDKYWENCDKYWYNCGARSCQAEIDARVRSCQDEVDAKVRSCKTTVDARVRSCQADIDMKMARCEYANKLVN